VAGRTAKAADGAVARAGGAGTPAWQDPHYLRKFKTARGRTARRPDPFFPRVLTHQPTPCNPILKRSVPPYPNWPASGLAG
jgi:hypothetical protein